MKPSLLALAAALSLACSSAALAHGAAPKHGGVVASAGDLAFELVAKDGKAVLYVSDHGRDLPTQGAGGKLTVLQAGRKSETVLAPSGHNTLTSRDPVALGAGAKAVAALTLVGKQPISVRFAFKQ